MLNHVNYEKWSKMSVLYECLSKSSGKSTMADSIKSLCLSTLIGRHSHNQVDWPAENTIGSHHPSSFVKLYLSRCNLLRSMVRCILHDRSTVQAWLPSLLSMVGHWGSHSGRASDACQEHGLKAFPKSCLGVQDITIVSLNLTRSSALNVLISQPGPKNSKSKALAVACAKDFVVKALMAIRNDSTQTSFIRTVSLVPCRTARKTLHYAHSAVTWDSHACLSVYT